MERTLFKIVDICRVHRLEETFIYELYRNGLIEIILENEQDCIDEEQLPLIEKFSNWHYDLELNMQGIEVVSRLLERIEQLQQEVRALKRG
ncbi:MerR family transcriptional regulator [Sphingobacterium sp. SGG-5]|uniref:chaperone modulator CbpM n=1 Tax=Sphingobacterium sp. SGG-5 TaxID=2710881 RepID=UPI0013EC0F2B|nr:chaperone modulator CbpM [Sphingobacterium sp. SGG-5]NGM62865.1 MerR family transcriptional regulator [Sphingobacterium sp. SGG-5]